MREAWGSAAGPGSSCKFTDADLDAVSLPLHDAGHSWGEIATAWNWFLTRGPDGKPRRSLGAATPSNFAKFGWQSWCARMMVRAVVEAKAGKACEICGGVGMIYVRCEGLDTGYRCRCGAGDKPRARSAPPVADHVYEAAQKFATPVVLEEWLAQEGTG